MRVPGDLQRRMFRSACSSIRRKIPSFVYSPGFLAVDIIADSTLSSVLHPGSETRRPYERQRSERRRWTHSERDQERRRIRRHLQRRRCSSFDGFYQAQRPIESISCGSDDPGPNRGEQGEWKE
jgi:hypothetical protein